MVGKEAEAPATGLAAAAQIDGGEVGCGERALGYGPELVEPVGGENRFYLDVENRVRLRGSVEEVVINALEFIGRGDGVVGVGEREEHVIGEEYAVLELERCWGGVKENGMGCGRV